MAYGGASGGSEIDLVDYAQQLCRERLNAYRAAPHDAEEHANIELSVLAGGYAYRQIAELVQNAADAVADVADNDGRIVIEVDDAGLWAANTGAPVDRAGVRALLNAHASGKRAGQIGRFGLGFKSLLKLGGRIAVLSRTVSLLFDPKLCRDQVRSALGLTSDAPAPGLRLAEAVTWEVGLDLSAGARRLAWATTIVFTELVTDGAREAVIEEMRRFPSEFLLFLPGDVDLVLKGPELNRHLRRRTQADGSVVVEDLAGEARPTQIWRVFETEVRISDAAALQDATSVHAREAVPLIWAAPIGAGREVAGRFFAFFPTTSETRTLGILNAPWKLNSDRTAVIPGAWNAALMEAAADLITASLPELTRDDDPGAVLDAFPRELQHQNEPAAPLVLALWSQLTGAAVLPNCNGDLVEPKNLRRAPQDSSELISVWSRLAPSEECARHLHASCTASVARAGRLRQLAERLTELKTETGCPKLAPTGAARWLDMAASDDPDDAVEVLKLADAWAKSATGYLWDTVRDEIRLILAADGTLETAPNVTLAEPAEPPFKTVHPVLSSDPVALRILENRFQLSGEGVDWGRLLDARITAAEESGDWESVWALLRKLPRDELNDELRYRSFKVRSMAGWADPDTCFRLGGLVLASDLLQLTERELSHVHRRLIDHGFHHRDDTLLNVLKVGHSPKWDWVRFYQVNAKPGLDDEWLNRWQGHWINIYWENLAYRPEKTLLGPTPFEMPVGWDLLLVFSGDAQRRIASALFDVIAASPGRIEPVTFHHRTRSNAWKTEDFPHPLWSLLLERGTLPVNARSIPFKSLLIEDVRARADFLPSLTQLAEGLDQLQTAGAGWESTREKDAIWADWFAVAAEERCEAQDLAGFFEYAARDGFAPKTICSPGGPVDLTEIMVAASFRDAATARTSGIKAVSLNHESQKLWLGHGARSMAAETAVEWLPAHEEAEAVLLVDLEPALHGVIRDECISKAGVVFALIVEQRIGDKVKELDWVVQDGRLIVCEESFLTRGWTDRVRLLVEGAEACDWLVQACDYDELLNSGVDARRRHVASEPDLRSRLLKAVGGVDVICGLFEPEIGAELRGDPARAASVAITMMGPALLAEPSVRASMAREGLDPPERWGSEAAASFVAALGFPAEFAISPARRRDPEMLVSGPTPLKPLHDYQDDVVASVDLLLAEPPGGKRRRAIVSLPTGAGKTRVAAQTAVTRILAPVTSINRLVIWVAQTDELCEQAVQCFRELWANLGQKGENLRIIRLWGGQANPQPPERDEPTVVIASIQTLNSRLSAAPLAWVSKPGLVVIDECHHALTSSYTGLLKSLGGGDDGDPPVIGLSATPFRGRNDDETEQLARRFDGRLLPRDQAGLFEKLQAQGVLARFRYTRLDMDERFDLTADEERHLQTFNRLPDTALERLGRNTERNDKILMAISEATERSALVFATSVAHARRLAARLNLLNVPSAVVSGETDSSSRRWFVEAFHRGDVRVLCNHSALTTGFDAPATDLIVIARPVFSPSLYMQMVGRGLRGPKNGGKAECRILTVQDNLDRYSDELAHHYFEKYYL